MKELAEAINEFGEAASNAGEELRKTFLLMQPLRKHRLPRKLKKRFKKEQIKHAMLIIDTWNSFGITDKKEGERIVNIMSQ